MRILAGLVLAVLPGGIAVADVSKEDVQKLVAAHEPDDAIIAYIRNHAPAPPLSTQDILDLKNAGASDEVITALYAASVPGGTFGTPLPGVVIPEGSDYVLDMPEYYPYYYDYYPHYYPYFYTYPGFSFYFFDPFFYHRHFVVHRFPYYGHEGWRFHHAYPYHPGTWGYHPWYDGGHAFHGYFPHGGMHGPHGGFHGGAPPISAPHGGGPHR